MYFDIAPPVSEQTLRNVRRSLINPNPSANQVPLASVLYETSVDTLRRTYIGFDYESSLGREKPSASSVVAGSKRARSPVADNEVDATNEHPPTCEVTQAQPPAAFEPSAVVDPPDYQGRSYLFPPTIDPSLAAKPARVPKRMLCVANGHQHGLQVLRWALPYGHVVFAGDVGGIVKVWNCTSAATARLPVATFKAHSLPITSLTVEDEGRALTTASHDGFLRRWDAEVGTVSHTVTYKGTGCSEHALHPENSQLVLAAFDKEIALFDLRSASKPQRLWQGHMGGIMSVAYLNNRGTMFVSSSSDKTLRTWDFRVPVQVRQLGDPSMHAASHLLRHPTDNVILAQSADNKVRMFDCDEGGRLRVVRDKLFTGHTVSGTSCMLAMSKDGQFLSSGDATGNVFVWNYGTQELARKFPAHAKQCSSHLWHPHEPSKMVTGGWDSQLKVWI
eukprot:GILI01024695.1.p1 GENE.GILI01024695.1~~GILI01024695.1.p1  ORF type:complete len:447 (+),score=58.73 GILI01024695.1:48-1388(+)